MVSSTSGEGVLGIVEQPAGLLLLPGDAVLLLLQEVEWDGTDQVGLEQPAAFIVEPSQALHLGERDVIVRVATLASQLDSERFLRLLGDLWPQRQEPVVVLDDLLDGFDVEVGQPAVALLLAANAEPVHVGVLGLRQAEPLPAVQAEH